MTNILDFYTPDQLIDGNLALQGLFCFGYVISSFCVYWNTYGGFDAVFLGIVYVCSVIFTYSFIRKSINRTKYGGILAASLFLVCISLQNAIFWGQYSNCGEMGHMSHKYNQASTTYSSPSFPPISSPNHPNDPIDNHPPPPLARALLRSIPKAFEKYDSQCYNVSAMKSVCTFSVFLFLSYIFQVFLLLRFKDELLGNGPLNEGYEPVSREEVNIPANHIPVSGIMPSRLEPDVDSSTMPSSKPR
jgi:hypothetical protein